VRNPTAAANTERAGHAQPPQRLEGAPSIACAGGERARLLALRGDPLGRRRLWHFTRFVTQGHEPPNACCGVSQWQGGTTVYEVLTPAGRALRRADPAGGEAVTEGDVAAVAGRSVAGVLS
jgi:hypothetical protein